MQDPFKNDRDAFENSVVEECKAASPLTNIDDVLSSMEFAKKLCERFTKSSNMADLDDAITHFRKRIKEVGITLPPL